jgi:uncharacterized membrane protein YfcA
MSFGVADTAVLLICAALSSMGMGGGSILILYLVSRYGMPQLEAQGISLLYFIPLSFASAAVYVKKGYIKLSRLAPVLTGAVLGALLGRAMLFFLDTDLLRRMFALFLTGYGVITVVSALKKDDNRCC